jgi:hypothetical protein
MLWRACSAVTLPADELARWLHVIHVVEKVPTAPSALKGTPNPQSPSARKEPSRPRTYMGIITALANVDDPA